jgi:hypothetical protein
VALDFAMGSGVKVRLAEGSRYKILVSERANTVVRPFTVLKRFAARPNEL